MKERNLGLFFFLLITCANIKAATGLFPKKVLLEEFLPKVHKMLIDIEATTELENSTEPPYNPETSTSWYQNININIDLFPEVFADGSTNCLYGGWISRKSRGRCLSPYTSTAVRDAEKNGRIAYERKMYCGSSRLFRCNPEVFGPGAPNDMIQEILNDNEDLNFSNGRRNNQAPYSNGICVDISQGTNNISRDCAKAANAIQKARKKRKEPVWLFDPTYRSLQIGFQASIGYIEKYLCIENFVEQRDQINLDDPSLTSCDAVKSMKQVYETTRLILSSLSVFSGTAKPPSCYLQMPESNKYISLELAENTGNPSRAIAASDPSTTAQINLSGLNKENLLSALKESLGENFVPRSAWSNRAPGTSWSWSKKPQQIVIHHTASGNDITNPRGSLRAIEKDHRVDRGWNNIGYHFVLARESGSWKLFEARSVYSQGAHAGKNKNPGRIGIAVLGNFEPYDASDNRSGYHPDTSEASTIIAGLEDALAKAIGTIKEKMTQNILQGRNHIPVLGHWQVSSSACPGNLIKEMVTRLNGGTTYDETPTPK